MQGRGSEIEKRKPICEKDQESGMVFLREGITAAFFLPMPFDEIATLVLNIFDYFLKTIPEDALTWASVGANSEEWKPVTKATYQQCRTLLKPQAVSKRLLTSFELSDGDEGGEAPNYGITIIGNRFDPELPDEKNLVQMYFPSEVIASDDVHPFVKNIIHMASTLPYISGYVSPGLHWAELLSDFAMQKARGIARRHPGYDVQDNVVARADIGKKVRGARWLSFIGPEILEQLGGKEKAKNAFNDPIEVVEVGHGLMIRAGEYPEIGDVNRKMGTPLLCEVAKFLEPVTLFFEEALIGREFGSPDDDFLYQWERRFLN